MEHPGVGCLNFLEPHAIHSCVSIMIPVAPHKTVAEVSKIGILQGRLSVVAHGWQSESTDGPKGGFSCFCFERLQGLQLSPHPQLLDAVLCSPVLVVVVAVDWWG